MKNLIRTQILKVRDTGLTNMFDVNGVMRVAYDHDLYDLVCYLSEKENHREYTHLILTGEAEFEDDGTPKYEDLEEDDDYDDDSFPDDDELD